MSLYRKPWTTACDTSYNLGVPPLRGPLGVRWIYIHMLSHGCSLWEGELKGINSAKRPHQKWGLISSAETSLCACVYTELCFCVPSLACCARHWGFLFTVHPASIGKSEWSRENQSEQWCCNRFHSYLLLFVTTMYCWQHYIQETYCHSLKLKRLSHDSPALKFYSKSGEELLYSLRCSWAGESLLVKRGL